MTLFTGAELAEWARHIFCAACGKLLDPMPDECPRCHRDPRQALEPGND